MYIIKRMNPGGTKGDMITSAQTREQVKRAYSAAFSGRPFPANVKLPRFGRGVVICWLMGGCYIEHV